MADRNVWRGMSENSQLAVLREMSLVAAIGALSLEEYQSAINTALDNLTETEAQRILAVYSARLQRAQWGA